SWSRDRAPGCGWPWAPTCSSGAARRDARSLQTTRCCRGATPISTAAPRASSSSKTSSPPTAPTSTGSRSTVLTCSGTVTRSPWARPSCAWSCTPAMAPPGSHGQAPPRLRRCGPPPLPTRCRVPRPSRLDRRSGTGALDADQQVVTNAAHTLLFAVNQGSDTIAVFRIARDGNLHPVKGSPFPSGGHAPTSVGLVGDTLVVANNNQYGVRQLQDFR